MRRAALIAVCLAAAGCGDDPPAPARDDDPATAVRVTLDADGRGAGRAREAELTCPSTRHAEACRVLLSLPAAAFEPVSRDVACTELFGGPETGRIVGTVRGRPVDARFARHNGCEIARFDRVQPILAVSGG